MNRNLQALVKACDQMGLRYDVQHSTRNIVTVYSGGEAHLFTNWATPLNPQSVMKLCQDKDYFIAYFEDVVKMPKTAAFAFSVSKTVSINRMSAPPSINPRADSA